MKYTIKINICQVFVIVGGFSFFSFTYAQNTNGYYDTLIPIYKSQSVIVCHQPNRDCFNVTVRPADWRRIVMPEEQYVLDAYKYAELQKKISIPAVVVPDKNKIIPKISQSAFILNGDVWDDMQKKIKISIQASAADGALLHQNFNEIKDTSLRPVWENLIKLNAEQKKAFEVLYKLSQDPINNRTAINKGLADIQGRMQEIQENLKKLDEEAASLEKWLALKPTFAFTEKQRKLNEDEKATQQEKLKVMRQGSKNAIDSLGGQQSAIDEFKARLYKPIRKP